MQRPVDQSSSARRIDQGKKPGKHPAVSQLGTPIPFGGTSAESLAYPGQCFCWELQDPRKCISLNARNP